MKAYVKNKLRTIHKLPQGRSKKPVKKPKNVWYPEHQNGVPFSLSPPHYKEWIIPRKNLTQEYLFRKLNQSLSPCESGV